MPARILLFGLVVLSFIGWAPEQSHGRASYYSCGSPVNWVGGRANNYGTSTHPSTFTTGSATTCLLSISPSSTTYTPGQTFSITVKAAGLSGFKVNADSGSWSGPSSGGGVSGQCVNYDLAQQSTGTQTFKAPASGTVTMKSICETRSGSAYVSNTITLTLATPTNAPVATPSPFTPAPTTLSPTTAAPTTKSPFTASPFTAGPTSVGQTRSPSLSPTLSTNSPTRPPTTLAPTTLQPTTRAPTFTPSKAPITSSPTFLGQSQDPNFIFEWPIDPLTMLRYSVNDTHGKFKLMRTGTAYLGVGVGQTMIGSTALIGMVGSGTSGLYSIVANAGKTTADIATPLATTAAVLQTTYGISQMSYGVINGNTTLSFTIKRAAQSPDFTLIQPDGTNINLLVVAGPDESNGKFCANNICYAHTIDSAMVLTDTNFQFAPGNAPFIPLPSKLTQELVIHIITMLLGWGFFIPLGIIIPLFNNIKYSPKRRAVCGISGPMWLKYHWVLQCIGLVFTYVGTAYGYIETGGDHWRDPHCQLGLFLLIISIIKPIYAFLRPSRKSAEAAKRVARQLFDYLHVPIGYAVTFIAIAENLVGIQEIQDVTAAGTDTYLFLGTKGTVGFGGQMGMAVVAMSVIMGGIIVLGLARAFFNMYFGGSAAGYVDMDDDVDNPVKPEKKKIPMSEVASHTSEKSFRTIYNGKVYDITPFLNSHPGGKKIMLPYAGKDMTEAYDDAGHSAQATAMFRNYYVGELATMSFRPRSLAQQFRRSLTKVQQNVRSSMRMMQAAAAPYNPYMGGGGTVMASYAGDMYSSAANPVYAPLQAQYYQKPKFLTGGNQQRLRVQLTKKTALSHNTYSLKFSFQDRNMVLGLPIGKHIAIYAPNIRGTVPGKWNNAADSEASLKEIQRKFTPISCDELDVGYFELVVKIYRPCRQFPDGGKMSRYLDSLREGSTIEVAGPFGTHQYLGRGRFKDGPNELLFNEVAMIAGGSGIAPMMQIFNAMLRDGQDRTRISLVVANSTVDDTLLKNKLDMLELQYPERFRVWYTVSQQPSVPWKYSVGRMNAQMLAQHLPRASRNTICIMSGPQPMMDHASRLLQQTLGYPESSIVEY